METRQQDEQPGISPINIPAMISERSNLIRLAIDVKFKDYAPRIPQHKEGKPNSPFFERITGYRKRFHNWKHKLIHFASQMKDKTAYIKFQSQFN